MHSFIMFLFYIFIWYWNLDVLLFSLLLCVYLMSNSEDRLATSYGTLWNSLYRTFNRLSITLSPEWPNRQGGCFAYWWLQGLFPSEATLNNYTMHEALRRCCPWGWGVRPVNWIYRLFPWNFLNIFLWKLHRIFIEMWKKWIFIEKNVLGAKIVW